MAMNKKIALFSIVQGFGSSDDEISKKRSIWCEDIKTSTLTKINILSLNFTFEKRVAIWKAEYKNESHAEFEGENYKISAIADGVNNFQIILILSKEG